LCLAACGRSEAPSPAGAETASVTLGHAGPLTGSIAHQGKDDENGVALAIEQANARKLRIGGKVVTFRMMSEDDQGDPKIGTTVAQKLVDAKVAAVIGHLNSGVSIPASDVYNRAGIPMISGSATNPTLTERGLKTVFRTVGRGTPWLTGGLFGIEGSVWIGIVELAGVALLLRGRRLNREVHYD